MRKVQVPGGEAVMSNVMRSVGMHMIGWSPSNAQDVVSGAKQDSRMFKASCVQYIVNQIDSITDGLSD